MKVTFYPPPPSTRNRAERSEEMLALPGHSGGQLNLLPSDDQAVHTHPPAGN